MVSILVSSVVSMYSAILCGFYFDSLCGYYSGILYVYYSGIFCGFSAGILCGFYFGIFDFEYVSIHPTTNIISLSLSFFFIFEIFRLGVEFSPTVLLLEPVLGYLLIGDTGGHLSGFSLR